MTLFLTKSTKSSVPITFLKKPDLAALPPAQQAWLHSVGFTLTNDKPVLMPQGDGAVAAVYVAHPATFDTWTLARIVPSLPAGLSYYLTNSVTADVATKLCLGWALGSYDYAKAKPWPKLVWIDGADKTYVTATLDASTHGRDLINQPPNILTPTALAAAAKRVADAHGASYRLIRGEDLLEHNFPLVYAVGKASAEPPCLVDMRWGSKGKKITLVGKGVCFDSGGLDIKSSSTMKLMKKDMGGAAIVLAIAKILMRVNAPIQLRVLIPVVENAISANAMRVSDVYPSRKGINVEIGNTDAEGRLILADALTYAAEDKPDLIIDCATLTGAARVALGTEVPALFTNRDVLASKLMKIGQGQDDPLWHLPLWQGYRSQLTSRFADIHSTGESSFGGAIVAALFLNEFVPPTIPWVHVDVMAWNLREQAGRPIGGEVMGARALAAFILSF